jgi:DNA-binding response OmpR family regulator
VEEEKMVNNTILAVDISIDVHEYQSAEWAKYGINSLRVESMHEAISLLLRSNEFFFVAINEDTIKDFMLQLRIMRDVTDIPIFFLTSNYTVDKKIKAMNFGADAYDPFNEYVKDNVLSTLELLKAQNRWAKRKHTSMPVLAGGSIILSQSRRKVFVDNTEVSLTKKEFDILRYLMVNSGHVVTHVRLLQNVWGEEYSETDTEVLWRTINRLRNKLSKAFSADGYIKVERGVGYQFLP